MYLSVSKEDFNSIDADLQESPFTGDDVLHRKLSPELHLGEVGVLGLGGSVLHSSLNALVQVFALLNKIDSVKSKYQSVVSIFTLFITFLVLYLCN